MEINHSEPQFRFSCEDGMEIKKELLCQTTDTLEYALSFEWTEENATKDDEFRIEWNVVLTEALYEWAPWLGMAKSPLADWSADVFIETAIWAPEIVMFNGRTENVYSLALDQCKKSLGMKAGVHEEDGTMLYVLRLKVGQYERNITKDCIRVRISTAKLPLWDELRRITGWWEQLGYIPAEVPESARKPLYSSWYSYHWDFTDKELEDEFKLAKDLGMDTVIVDGGWYTDAICRGSAYAGDWEKSPRKYPNWKQHIDRVHQMGMKYLLWMGVSFMGVNCKHYEEFRDYSMGTWQKAWVLDPRFKKVRDYIVSSACRMVKEWELDGLKLDFVDCFRELSAYPYRDGMDYRSVGEAVSTLLSELYQKLNEIKPNLLLEFRQGYVGPEARRYGNFFRVADCPADYIRNRIGILDLRMSIGNSAVHADMIMWNPASSASTNALQIISSLFGVPQISVKIAEQSEETKQMLKFLLNFMRKYESVLQGQTIQAYEPHLGYTWAKTWDEKTCIAACYSIGKCLIPENKSEIFLWNGSEGDYLIAELPDGLFNATIFDCTGKTVQRLSNLSGGLTKFTVPVSGLVQIEAV